MRWVLLGSIAAGCWAQTSADCAFFGPAREKIADQARARMSLRAATDRVWAGRALPRSRAGVESRRGANEPANLVDQYIFAALGDAGATPAATTTDAEFIRRATLDLTGRIPTRDRLLQFLASTDPNKRAALVDELLASPDWVDKWTMYFGDHFKNATRKTQVVMFADGRNAFYQWIKDSLTANKPYDQMAREIISAKGDNSYDAKQGPINWLVGGIVTGGPQQDIWDQQAANIAETFLGISHLNCLMCHNGSGHLTSLSLWGGQTRRVQAWGMSAFLSHSAEVRTNVTGSTNQYYWGIQDDVRFKTDYALNTTTGNRPARAGYGLKTASPAYLWTGETPKPGENYRDALARMVTADFQFARATVNYIWAEFFGRGIVDPVNQFDPARLDPDNPPEAPWTLQPSNPRLLNALAQDFIDHGYDIKYLMRVIANSDAYQLSSRYDGNWNPAWEPLFARKLVRRLWGEEVLDAIAQASGVVASFNANGFGRVDRAMRSPEPIAIGSAFLNAFLPGNRDDQDRRDDGAVQQAMYLMNDNYVVTRSRASANGVVAQGLKLKDDEMVDLFWTSVLSRYPDPPEKDAALKALASGNRQQKAEDLFWSLFNKLDFVFNY